MLCPTHGSREVTPSSEKEAPSNVAAHDTQEGVKGGKKRHKQRLQGATTTTNHDDEYDGEAGGSGVRRTSIGTCSGKRRAGLPTDHFKGLLKEACSNHAYPIRHKLKDCGMMRSFMTSRSLTWGVELDEGPDGSDTMPFSDENVVMTVYEGHPPLPPSRRRHISNPSPGAPTRCGWGHGGSGV
jgi:hypothetical protein